MADYPAGVYDLYMKYLNEMDQSGVAVDFETYASQLPYNIEQGDGGSGGGGGGYGQWGNLDESDTKSFMKDVWSRDMVSGPQEAIAENKTTPTFSWQPEEITGFKNVNTGQYQTFEGKNIEHGGIDFSGLMGIAAEALGLTEKTGKYGDYNLGQIAGTFTGYDPKTGYKGLRKHLNKRKIRNQLLDNLNNQKIQKEVDAYNKASAAKAAEAQRQKQLAQSSQVIYDQGPPGGGGTWHEQTAAKEQAFADTGGKQGKVAGPGFGQGAYFEEGGRVGYADGTPIADVTETEATLIGDDNVSLLDFLKITGGGGYGENTDIMYEGEIIPGLDQTNYGYGFDVGAEVPIGNTGLTLTGDVGIGRGSTQTDYMGENVPFLSGVGETKLGDKWNVGIEGKWPVNFNELFMEEGGRVGFLKGSPDDTKEVMETPTEPGSDKMAYFPGDVFSSSQVRALFKDRSLSTNMDRKQLYHILMNPGKYPAAESMLLRLLKQKGLQSGGLAGLPN